MKNIVLVDERQRAVDAIDGGRWTCFCPDELLRIDSIDTSNLDTPLSSPRLNWQIWHVIESMHVASV
jgi:hypothetical protein